MNGCRHYKKTGHAESIRKLLTDSVIFNLSFNPNNSTFLRLYCYDNRFNARLHGVINYLKEFLENKSILVIYVNEAKSEYLQSVNVNIYNHLRSVILKEILHLKYFFIIYKYKSFIDRFVQ